MSGIRLFSCKLANDSGFATNPFRIKGMHGSRIILPHDKRFYPDNILAEKRYGMFRKTG